MNRAWHYIGIIVAVVFLGSMFFGYYTCKNNESCTAPFFDDFESLSQDEVQSKLTGLREKLKKSIKTLKQTTIFDEVSAPPVSPTPPVPTDTDTKEKEEKEEPEQEPELYYELFPADWYPTGVIMANGNGGSVRKETAEALRAALAPFRETLKNITFTIYVYYNTDALGKGIRAYATNYGDVMCVIAPDAYSLRKIPEREWIALVRHEMGHVLHDKILTSADWNEWDNSFLESGKPIKKAAASTYSLFNRYELFAEGVIMFLFTDANEVIKDNEVLAKMYEFMNKRFKIEEFALQRDPFVFDSDNLEKDFTRVPQGFPLPRSSSQ